MRKGIVTILSTLAGVVTGAGVASKVAGKKTGVVQKYADKHLALFLMMNEWVKVKQKGKNLSVYFERKGYKRIAIYGMSYAGETLLEELKGTGVEVVYAIDQKADSLYADVDIVSMEETLEEVDAVVVTAVTFFDEKVNCPVISLEDILYEV